MDIIDKAINNYIEKHTSPEPDVLQKLNRDTYDRVLMPRMLSGHVQGRVLAMLSKMIRPLFVLEIGTFTGYSAICLSEGIQSGGKLITIDVNEELESMVRGYFKDACIEEKIDYRVGRAADIIPGLEYEFDIVFIDADKCNYSLYYELVFNKVKSGGYIIADNVLWSGKVVEDAGKDKDLTAILQFNAMVQDDRRVENVLLSVRDGLMVLRKI